MKIEMNNAYVLVYYKNLNNSSAFSISLIEQLKKKKNVDKE